MSGLYSILSVGAESLHASRQGVDTTGHNIANAHTEGYSRQRINLAPRDPLDTRGLVIGNGVYVKSITRAHDKFVENEINELNQEQGQSKQTFEELKRVEGIYSPESSITVADELSKFFNSLQDLSQFPDDLIVRTNVKEMAGNLAGSFQKVDRDLRQAQRDINEKIIGEAERINTLVENIGKLNIAINSMELNEQTEANDLRDQQDKLLRELSQKISINYYRSDRGMLTVRGPDETLLVDRGFTGKIGVVPKEGSPGFVDIAIYETENSPARLIGDSNRSGMMRGLFDVRDKSIEKLLKDNNLMAKTLADNINQVHRQGFGIKDFNNTTGRDFFVISDDFDEAARSIEVSSLIEESTDAISVAATPEAAGDNLIVNEMLRVGNSKLMDNGKSTLNEFYANYVGVFGLEIQRADHQKQAQDILLSELHSRREAVAGVSLDEEAMNLMRWQSNFTASSRVITTVDEMLDTVLNLKR
jgi:flagellar hook-associated protein 1 FlgK